MGFSPASRFSGHAVTGSAASRLRGGGQLPGRHKTRLYLATALQCVGRTHVAGHRIHSGIDTNPVWLFQPCRSGPEPVSVNGAAATSKATGSRVSFIATLSLAPGIV